MRAVAAQVVVSRRSSLLSLALCSALAGGAQAATVCVTTGDQLASALATAQGNNQGDDLRITLGTKTRNLGTGFTRWTYTPAANDVDEDLKISGGWVGPDCLTQFKGGLTVLDAEQEGPLLDINLPSGVDAIFEISALKLVRGRATTVFGASQLRFNALAGSTPQVLIEGLTIRDSGSTGDSGGAVRIALAGGGTANVRNNVLTNNTSFSGAVMVFDATGNNASINVSNNSVIANNDTETNAPGPVGGVSAFGGGTVVFANNLFHGNTSSNPSDLSVVNFSVLSNNHIGNLRGTPLGNTNTTTGDPKVVVNNSGFPVPVLGSPLVDAGTPIVVGGVGTADARGADRVQGTRVDRGAIEFDGLFRNGFE